MCLTSAQSVSAVPPLPVDISRGGPIFESDRVSATATGVGLNKPDKGGGGKGGGGGKPDKGDGGGGKGGGGGKPPKDGGGGGGLAPPVPVAPVSDVGVSGRPAGRGGDSGGVAAPKKGLGGKKRNPLGLVPRGSGFGKSLLGA